MGPGRRQVERGKSGVGHHAVPGSPLESPGAAFAPLAASPDYPWEDHDEVTFYARRTIEQRGSETGRPTLARDARPPL